MEVLLFMELLNELLFLLVYTMFSIRLFIKQLLGDQWKLMGS